MRLNQDSTAMVDNLTLLTRNSGVRALAVADGRNYTKSQMSSAFKTISEIQYLTYNRFRALLFSSWRVSYCLRDQKWSKHALIQE